LRPSYGFPRGGGLIARAALNFFASVPMAEASPMFRRLKPYFTRDGLSLFSRSINKEVFQDEMSFAALQWTAAVVALDLTV